VHDFISAPDDFLILCLVTRDDGEIHAVLYFTMGSLSIFCPACRMLQLTGAVSASDPLEPAFNCPSWIYFELSNRPVNKLTYDSLVVRPPTELQGQGAKVSDNRFNPSDLPKSVISPASLWKQGLFVFRVSFESFFPGVIPGHVCEAYVNLLAYGITIGAGKRLVCQPPNLKL